MHRPVLEPVSVARPGATNSLGGTIERTSRDLFVRDGHVSPATRCSHRSQETGGSFRVAAQRQVDPVDPDMSEGGILEDR